MTRLFVFDLGNVILPFDNQPIAEKLWERSSKKRSSREVFSYLFDVDTGAINPYEEGRCSSESFFRSVKDVLGLRCELEEFAQIWNDIFCENEGVVRIIKDLKDRHFPLFLLSNTNELHFSYIRDRYPVVHLMDEWILSYEVGAKKPKRAIFDAIFSRTDVKGSEILYVDDVKEYVEQAKLLGIEGTVFTSAESLSATIEASL
jgi:glucose-1-phosphatase